MPTAESESDRLFIEWKTKRGLILNLTLQDLQAANHLLELVNLDSTDAIEAIRCAAFMRPRIFTSSATAPSNVVKAWNRKFPPGTEIRFWQHGRNNPCVMTRTATQAFSLGGVPIVVVQDRLIGGVALADCDPVGS